MKVIVSNIQRFCLHDGPGIRTTIFFKGCNLRCPWCANPESIEHHIQEYEYCEEKGFYGKEMTLEQLEKDILKDIEYYDTGGGVTFSGGEPLLQFKKIEPLLKRLKEKSINICIETALSVPTDLVNIAIRYVDEFIIDIKVLDKESVNQIHGNVELYYKNIDTIFTNKKDITFRIPLAKGYIITRENINLIIDLLEKYTPNKVEMFKIHKLAEKKYKTLNKVMVELEEITDHEIEDIKRQIELLGIQVKVCKI